ncbi:MAG TPA: rhomboid family intramembrane serine protease [Bryobacteraceae bacterium]|nr:rhomboid family intramembrane serine protease [Bryobacteraceae bacterium]
MFPLRDTQKSYSKPVVTILLIVVNILVFLYEFSLNDFQLNHFIATYGLVPARFSIEHIFTAMFLHGGWFHVLGNMWFLWIFGDNIEDILGHGKYLMFYLMCGVAAALLQTYFNYDSRVPMVGASGAIAGVMGAYMVKFPRARILTFVLIIFFFYTFEVPAWLMLIYWFVLQLFGGFDAITESQYSQGGGTAFFAHVGGFIAGMILIHLLGTRERYYHRRDLYW